MTRAGLTHIQRELLAFIEAEIAETGVAPSYDEMRAHLELKSKSGIHRLLNCLEQRGAIVRMPGRARAIALPPHGLTLSPDLSAELRRRFGWSPQVIEAGVYRALSTGVTPP